MNYTIHLPSTPTVCLPPAALALNSTLTESVQAVLGNTVTRLEALQQYGYQTDIAAKLAVWGQQYY